MQGKSLFDNQKFKFFIFVIVLIIGWQLWKYFNFSREQLQAYLSNYPLFLQGLMYVSLYVGITTFVWIGPKDVFRVAGAILLGPYVSTLFVWIAESCNAAIMFLLSRSLGREYVENKWKVKTEDIDKIKKYRGFLGVTALRINPLVPFRFMDLAYGVSQISLKKYFIISLLASPIRIFWLQFIIYSMSHVLLKERENILEIIPEVMEFFTKNPLIIKYSAFYFLVVILLSLLAIVIKIIKGFQNRNG